jgi:hypothetical protein
MSDALAGILESKQAERLATGFVSPGPVWHPDASTTSSTSAGATCTS